MASMQFATIDALTLHYAFERADKGIPLVFINSLGTDLRIWEGVVQLLATRFSMLRYDKRGHGLSDCPPGPYTIRDHAHDLAGLLDGLAMPAAILVGLSVGGMIALDFASQHPDRVQALILCDTGATIGTAEYWAERVRAVRQQGIAPLAESILMRWFSSTFATQHPAAYRGYANMLTRTPVEGYIATCEAIRNADLRTVARSIQQPALVLCGDADLATPPELGRALAAALPNARFALVSGAGHLPCIEQPETLATQINHFVEEVHSG